MNMRKLMVLVVHVAAVLIVVFPLYAQKSAHEMSKIAANPLSNLVNIPLQNNTNFVIGPYNRTVNVLNIEPVIPLAGGSVITRTIFPVLWIPDITAETGMWSSGLGDILFSTYYVLPVVGGGIWGLGASLELPSGGEKRGNGKWCFGPSFGYLIQPGDWTMGFLLTNIWSFAGDSERSAVSKMIVDLAFLHQLGGGWYVNSAPIITVDWEASPGQQWVVPLGAGGGKVSLVGKAALNLQIGAFYNIVRPDIGPEWQLQLQAQMLFPT